MKFSRLAFASLVFSADLLLVVVAVEQREPRWGRELSFHSGVDVGGERGEGCMYLWMRQREEREIRDDEPSTAASQRHCSISMAYSPSM